MEGPRQKLNIVIENVTDAQAIAICDLLAVWQQAGSLGCSRWTSLFADGDGNFRPRISVDGKPAPHQTIVNPNQFWTNGWPWRGEYRIDFDVIAWKLHENKP